MASSNNYERRVDDDAWDNTQEDRKIPESVLCWSILRPEHPMPHFDCNKCKRRRWISGLFRADTGRPLFRDFALNMANSAGVSEADAQQLISYANMTMPPNMDGLVSVEPVEPEQLGQFTHYDTFIEVSDRAPKDIQTIIGGHYCPTYLVNNWWKRISSWISQNRRKFSEVIAHMERQIDPADPICLSGKALTGTEKALQVLRPMLNLISDISPKMTPIEALTMARKNPGLWVSLRHSYIEFESSDLNPRFLVGRFGLTYQVNQSEAKMERITHSHTITFMWHTESLSVRADVYPTAYAVTEAGVCDESQYCNWENHHRTAFGGNMVHDVDDTNQRGGHAREVISFDPEELKKNGFSKIMIDMKMYNDCRSQEVAVDVEFSPDNKENVRNMTLVWRRGAIAKRTTFTSFNFDLDDYIVPTERRFVPMSICPYVLDLCLAGEVLINSLAIQNSGHGPNGETAGLLVRVSDRQTGKMPQGFRSEFIKVPLGRLNRMSIPGITDDWCARIIGIVGRYRKISADIPERIRQNLCGPTVAMITKNDFEYGYEQEAGRVRGKPFKIHLIVPSIRQLFGVDIGEIVMAYTFADVLSAFELII